MRRPILATLAILVLAGPVPARAEPPAVSTSAVRLGLLPGGRTNLLYRAYAHGCFEEAGVGVDLYVKSAMGEAGFAKIPPDGWFPGYAGGGPGADGAVAGVQIVDRIAGGELDGGAIREAAFLDAVERGMPVVAVAVLGHQSADKPGHAIVLRAGVKIERPEDFKGKTLVSRRSGPMDAALLREFIRKLGLDPDKDVKLPARDFSGDAVSLLAEGKADGGFFPLPMVKDLIERRAAVMHRLLDWDDPEMLQGLLVFNADFLKRSPDKVQRIVDACVDRIAYENSLPKDKTDRSRVDGLMMPEDYQGLTSPTCDAVPRVRAEVLREGQGLLAGRRDTSKPRALETFIDNTFVERAAARPAAAAGRCLAHPRLPFQNVLLIGWDGTRRERLRALLDQGKLPNLARLIAEGQYLDMDVTVGETFTKPGWAQILTGYVAEITGVYSNRRRYGAIPAGYTLPERLKARFGDGITTIFLAGKKANLGARGPHRICVNCERDLWDDEDNYTKKSRVPPDQRRIVEMPAEPYHLTKDHVDVFAVGLGAMDRVGARVLEALDAQAEKKFFMFAHFEEPDEMGHVFGEGAPEYSDSLIRLDAWLGRIVAKLKDRRLDEKTLIYLVSDHGFGKNDINHKDEPETIFVTNDPAVARGKADRLDVTPTLLDRYGFDLGAVKPPLNGRSLLEGD